MTKSSTKEHILVAANVSTRLGRQGIVNFIHDHFEVRSISLLPLALSLTNSLLSPLPTSPQLQIKTPSKKISEKITEMIEEDLIINSQKFPNSYSTTKFGREQMRELGIDSKIRILVKERGDKPKPKARSKAKAKAKAQDPPHKKKVAPTKKK
jgi:hypothetical protein